MRQFLLKAFVFFVAGWVIFSGLDRMLSGCFQKTNYKAIEYWSYLVKEGIDADMVFLGSSRVLNHFAPYVLDSVLSLNSYNLGIAGAHFDDMLARYRLYREKNKPPKVVLIGIDYFSLLDGVDRDKYQFYPWFHDRSFRKAVFRVTRFSLQERFLPLFRYNGVWMQVISGRGDWSLEKGFLALDKSSRGDDLEDYSFWFRIDSEVENAFRELLDLIASDGAKTIFVQPPLHESALRKRRNPVEMKEYYDSVSLSRGIAIIDHEHFSFSGDTSFFVDALHMNRCGAEVFTDSLAHDLMRLGLLN